MPYVAYSPDGFTLSADPIFHPTREAAQAEIDLWISRFQAQGYYFTGNRERISLREAWCRCSIEREDPETE